MVDEVLAVGDAEFQKKCLQKMRDIGQGGRTILFVSHNHSALRHICDRGLFLDRGCLKAEGEINKVIDHYLSTTSQNGVKGKIETESFAIEEVEIASLNGSLIKTFDQVEIKVRFTAKIDILDPSLYISVSLDNQRLTGLDFKDFETLSPILNGCSAELSFVLSSLPLLPGSYQLEMHLRDAAQQKIEVVPQTFAFDVVETPVYGGRKLDGWCGHLGLVAKTRSQVFPPDTPSTSRVVGTPG
jgi:lipopolysaccharide transport system ATP-binding protein